MVTAGSVQPESPLIRMFGGLFAGGGVSEKRLELRSNRAANGVVASGATPRLAHLLLTMGCEFNCAANGLVAG
jgi:hypothetical protein